MTRRLVDTAILEAKSVARAMLGIPDPWRLFRRFESRIHADTWLLQQETLAWSERFGQTHAESSPDGIADGDLRRGLETRARVLALFKDAWLKKTHRWRVLIHLPDFIVSPAGYSLFWNLGAGLKWLGIPVEFWKHGTPIRQHLIEFEPTLLLSIDHIWYDLCQQPNDHSAHVESYRRDHELTLGLSSNHFSADPVVLDAQLELGRKLLVDFFYSFQCPEYVADRYRLFHERGFKVLSLEFAANPLVYYPLPDITRDINYVYLAATNFEKWTRCCEYLDAPLSRRSGVIVGPGWSKAASAMVTEDQARALYARARIGLNLHVPFQIAAPSEINERAYNLAAAAVPQLTDRPALLAARLSDNAVFAADSPAEYAEQFEYMLSHPEEAKVRGLRAMEEILQQHTIFHRAEALLAFASELGSRA